MHENGFEKRLCCGRRVCRSAFQVEWSRCTKLGVPGIMDLIHALAPDCAFPSNCFPDPDAGAAGAEEAKAAVEVLDPEAGAAGAEEAEAVVEEAGEVVQDPYDVFGHIERLHQHITGPRSALVTQKIGEAHPRMLTALVGDGEFSGPDGVPDGPAQRALMALGLLLHALLIKQRETDRTDLDIIDSEREVFDKAVESTQGILFRFIRVLLTGLQSDPEVKEPGDFEGWDWRKRRSFVIPYMVQQMIFFLDKPHSPPDLIVYIGRLLDAYCVPSPLVTLFNHLGVTPAPKRTIKELIRRLGGRLSVDDVAHTIIQRTVGGPGG